MIVQNVLLQYLINSLVFETKHQEFCSPFDATGLRVLFVCVLKNHLVSVNENTQVGLLCLRTVEFLAPLVLPSVLVVLGLACKERNFSSNKHIVQVNITY